MRKTTERKIVLTPDKFLKLIGEDATNIIKVVVHQSWTFTPAHQITITLTEVRND